MKAWWDRNYEVLCCAIGIILILWLFAAAKSYAASCTVLTDIEPRYLTYSLDGDTISLFSIPQGKVKFRINHVDTPERGEPGWEEARDFTWDWLHAGPFTLETCWKPTFDRYVATVSRNGLSLADAIKEAGHGE